MSLENLFFNTNESGEKISTRQEIVEMLLDKGIESEEVKKSLSKYAEGQESLADKSNESNPRVKCAIHMAEVYFDAGYREYALESLMEMMQVNEDEETMDLIYESYNRLIESDRR